MLLRYDQMQGHGRPGYTFEDIHQHYKPHNLKHHGWTCDLKDHNTRCFMFLLETCCYQPLFSANWYQLSVHNSATFPVLMCEVGISTSFWSGLHLPSGAFCREHREAMKCLLTETETWRCFAIVMMNWRFAGGRRWGGQRSHLCCFPAVSNICSTALGVLMYLQILVSDPKTSLLGPWIT